MKKHAFKIAMLVYLAAGLLVIYLASGRLNRFLFAYEQSIETHTVDAFMEKLRQGDLTGLYVSFEDGEEITEDTRFYELSRLCALLKEALKDRSLTCIKRNADSDDDTAVYTILRDGLSFCSLRLEITSRTEDYDLPVWEAAAVTFPRELMPAYTVTVRVPKGSVVSVDGVVLGEEDMILADEPVTELAAAVEEGYLGEMPCLTTYRVNGYLEEPEVIALGSDGEEVFLILTDEERSFSSVFLPPEGFEEEISGRILAVIPVWGRYFSRDGGYEAVAPYLVPGSPVTRYLNRVDISWMQGHTGTDFEDLAIREIRWYSPDCFAADVHFVQHIYWGGEVIRDWETDLTWIFVKTGENGLFRIVDLTTNTAG